MTHSKPPTDRYCRNFSAIRTAMLIALALLPVGCNKDDQQTSKVPPAQPSSAQSVQPTSAPTESAPVQLVPVAAAKPLTDLESLVAPIALYPDP
jgi:PBP1b-binding outer membrane lipoprotein LpoB